MKKQVFELYKFSVLTLMQVIFSSLAMHVSACMNQLMGP